MANVFDVTTTNETHLPLVRCVYALKKDEYFVCIQGNCSNRMKTNWPTDDSSICHFACSPFAIWSVGVFSNTEAINKRNWAKNQFDDAFFVFSFHFCARLRTLLPISYTHTNQLKQNCGKIDNKTEIIMNQQKIKMDKIISTMMLANRIAWKKMSTWQFCKVWIQCNAYGCCRNVASHLDSVVHNLC